MNDRGIVAQVVAESGQDIGFSLIKEWQLIREESFERPEWVKKEEKKPREIWRAAARTRFAIYFDSELEAKKYIENRDEPEIKHFVELLPNYKMISRDDVEKAYRKVHDYGDHEILDSDIVDIYCKALGFEE